MHYYMYCNVLQTKQREVVHYLLDAVHGPVLVAAPAGPATAGEVRYVPPEENRL
jgi:hypothetical protein